MLNTGEGSFAKVYIGRHTLTNEEVVIKTVDKKKVLESNIYTEIEVLRKVSHPYINKLYAAYEQGTLQVLFINLEGGGRVILQVVPCSFCMERCTLLASLSSGVIASLVLCFGRQTLPSSLKILF